jgi:hypothetical protein
MTFHPTDYVVGQHVEVKFDTEWRRGVVCDIDADDAYQMFQVRDIDGDRRWPRPDCIRPFPTPPGQLEFRCANAGGWTDWKAVRPGDSLYFPVLAERIEFRLAPAHSDAEIVAKLREMDMAGELVAPDVSRVLHGWF